MGCCMWESVHLYVRLPITINAPLGVLPCSATHALILVMVCLTLHASSYGSRPVAFCAQIGTSIHTLNGVVKVTLDNATICV